MTPNPCTVLLIEDNPADARLIMGILREEPAHTTEVLHADNMARGLEALEQGGIAIVLLDLNLPDSSGYDTFVMLQKHAPTIPVIVLTGMDDMALAIRIVHDGAQDYMLKSLVDYTMLARSIRYSIERKEVEQERERLIKDLQYSLAHIKTLQGLLPICMYCKKIRDDKQYWQQVEEYIARHTEAQCSHGVCPDCYKKHMQSELDKMKKK